MASVDALSRVASAADSSAAADVVRHDDARMTNARTPTPHNHAGADINSGTVDVARLPTGTTGTTVALGNHTHSVDTPYTLTDGATINVNADNKTRSLHRVTLGGNRTFAKPTNLVDGALLTFEIKQDATGNRVPVWNAAYVFGTDIPDDALTTTGNRKDFISFVYNLADDKLYCLGVSRGFA